MSETQQALSVGSETKPPEVRALQEPKSLENILREQLTTLEEQHRLVLELEHPDAIHKMRVTTRRAQASLDLLQRPNDKRGVIKLKRKLRATRRLLSTVRNYDVFLDLTAGEAARTSKSLRAQFEVLSEVLRHRRGRRMAKIKGGLQQFHVEELAARIGLDYPMTAPAGIDPDALAPADPATEDIANIPPSPDSITGNELGTNEPDMAQAASEGPVPDGSATAEHELSDGPDVETAPVEPRVESAEAGGKTPQKSSRSAFDQRWIALHAADRLDQRLAEFELLASEAHAATKPAELHQLRIAAKRVRYLLELVSEMGFGNATRALLWLRSLQDRIGDWHDLEALEDEIVGIVSRQKFLKEHLAEGGVMLQAAAHLQNKKDQLVSKLFPVQIPKSLNITCVRISRALRRSVAAKPRANPRRAKESPSLPTSA
jgi:CHAD domain-containing protein